MNKMNLLTKTVPIPIYLLAVLSIILMLQFYADLKNKDEMSKTTKKLIEVSSNMQELMHKMQDKILTQKEEISALQVKISKLEKEMDNN